MAGITKTVEIWNAREQLLSADLMRAQFLSSRDDQNWQASWSRSIDATASPPAHASDLLGGTGTPISGLNLVPTLTAPSGFGFTVGAGEGFVYNSGLAGLTSDDSPYLVVRWTSAGVTHATPDSTNPRIDIIIATPAMVPTDSQSRTVLVDPVSRAVTAESLNKTNNPAATLSVVTGTPASSPAVPALPAGALPLFYVYVPPASGSAAAFSSCRASYRRTPYPFSAMSGVVSGMGLLWDLSQGPGGTAGMFCKGFHRVLIDGELAEFWMDFDSTVTGNVVADTANSPFASAAPAAWYKAYYIYAVGGRHNPMPCYNGGLAQPTLSPVTIVESMTPPTVATGKPSANMTVNGKTVIPDGATYIGLGFVVTNTTFRAPCLMTEDMTYFGTSTLDNLLQLTKAGTGVETLGTPQGYPTISNRARVALSLSTGSAVSSVQLVPDTGGGAASSMFATGGFLGATAITGSSLSDSNIGDAVWTQGEPPKQWVSGGHAADVVDLVFRAYNHRVRLFNGGINPA